MTQEDKELLLKDLCARLPHNCIVFIAEGGIDGLQWDNVTLNSYLLYEIEEENAFEFIKPYLSPMSSMTEEEEKKFNELKLSYHFDEDSYILFDWLNEHHFDYRGLIEKGLALEAPEGMYN